MSLFGEPQIEQFTQIVGRYQTSEAVVTNGDRTQERSVQVQEYPNLRINIGQSALEISKELGLSAHYESIPAK
jgi:hypothetical protein